MRYNAGIVKCKIHIAKSEVWIAKYIWIAQWNYELQAIKSELQDVKSKLWDINSQFKGAKKSELRDVKSLLWNSELRNLKSELQDIMLEFQDVKSKFWDVNLQFKGEKNVNGPFSHFLVSQQQKSS